MEGFPKLDSDKELLYHLNCQMKELQKNKPDLKNKFFSLFMTSKTLHQPDESKAVSVYKKNGTSVKNIIPKSKTVKSENFGNNFERVGINRVITNDQISKVSKAYSLTDFSSLVNRITSLREKLALHKAKIELLQQNRSKNAFQEKKIHIKAVIFIHNEMKDCMKYLSVLRQYLNTRKYSTNIAFVSFKFKSERDEFISNFGSTFLNRYIYPGKQKFVYKKNKLEVYEAPEPNEILWQNLGTSIYTKLWRRFVTYFASVFIVFISFLIVISLKSYQVSAKSELSNSESNEINVIGSNRNSLVISALISISIVLLSQIIILVLSGLTLLEKHYSTTDQKLSYIHKLTRMKLLNNCLVVILVYYFIETGSSLSWNILQNETLSDVDLNTFRLLVKDVSFIALSNCIFVGLGKWLVWIKSKINQKRRNYLLKNLDLQGELKEFDKSITEARIEDIKAKRRQSKTKEQENNKKNPLFQHLGLLNKGKREVEKVEESTQFHKLEKGPLKQNSIAWRLNSQENRSPSKAGGGQKKIYYNSDSQREELISYNPPRLSSILKNPISTKQKLDRNTIKGTPNSSFLKKQNSNDEKNEGSLTGKTNSILVHMSKTFEEAFKDIQLQPQKWKITHKNRKALRLKGLLQFQLNQVFEGPEIYLSHDYAEGISLFYLVLFFSPIIPWISMLACLCYIGLYFTQKYLYATCYKRPNEIGSRIGIDSIYRAGWGYMVYFIGIFISDTMLEKPKGYGFWILLSIAVLGFLVRMVYGGSLTNLEVKKDTEAIDGQKADITHLFKPYNLMRHNFENEYDRSNPITAEEKTKEYLQWIFGKFQSLLGVFNYFPQKMAIMLPQTLMSS